MDARRRWLAIINVAGGIAVLGSYVLAFALEPAIRSGLWGGVPEAWRGVYTVNMFAAAAGYFPFTFMWVFRTDPDDPRQTGRIGYGGVTGLYLAILVPSALWLPMTAQLLGGFSVPLWWATLAVLYSVGLAATLNLWVCALRARREGGALAWAAAVGAVPFFVQTAVLDAIVWPAYFPSTLSG